MVKRRTETKIIEDKAKRDAAFRTGRKVLFKMAREFGQDFGAEVAVITIHEAGNVFAFGHPNLTSVVQHYKEAKEAESSKRDDDDQKVVQKVQYLSADDFDETEESTDDDEDESNSDGKIKVQKDKSPFWKRDDDHQEVQYILGDQRNQSDQMDLSLSLSLPLRHNKVEENESSGMMIRNKSESGRGLAFDLLEGGSQKNGPNQEEQYLRKEVKMQGLSTADSSISSMIPSLLRKLLRVEDLELHELEQLMAEMEEIKKRILDRANQIMAEMEDLELHELEQLMAEMEEIEKRILDRDNQIMAEMEEIKKKMLDRANQIMKSSADLSGDSGKDSSM